MITIKREVNVEICSWEEATHEDRFLLHRAVEVRENAVAPYSHYKVGSAILWRKGHVSMGCNVENCVYEVLHGEKGAIGNGIAAHGLDKIMRVAVVGGPENKQINLPPARLEEDDFKRIASAFQFKDACVSCGQCTQDILEFCYGDMDVKLVELMNGLVVRIALGDLLTAQFGPWHLGVDYNKL